MKGGWLCWVPLHIWVSEKTKQPLPPPLACHLRFCNRTTHRQP